jgi:hypothetical protein
LKSSISGAKELGFFKESLALSYKIFLLSLSGKLLN